MVLDYIKELQGELATGNALEHTYRSVLKNLIEELDSTIHAVNEPKRSEHGSPDFIFFRKGNYNLILGYAETKNVNAVLNDIEKSEQLKRYLGYSRLILTNYIEFRFFRNGEKYKTIEIAKREGSFLRIIPENVAMLESELKAFLEGKPQRITNGKRLAEIMGGKAMRIRENVKIYLKDESDSNKELMGMYEVMKKLLVADLDIEKFADMYAQTLVYGLFVARYHDDTPENFTRQEARDLVPASNPFLQHFFDHIVGPNFDKRLGYIVDELCEIFSLADVKNIILQHFNLFGEATTQDPIIHFYEDFLKEYDPEQRKKMGAYYTPIPVVRFMVRAVDGLLKSEFGLEKGLADTTRIIRKVKRQGVKDTDTFHKVQVLDPSVGTATFLNEIIKYIYEENFKGQEGRWPGYVDKDLLPRLYGFELMMAPYTIAHLKLAMTLKESGYSNFNKRLGVYLTNTLEEGIKAQDDLFSGLGLMHSITEEAKAANIIKHEMPIMVIIGNPPYSVSSTNKSEFILNLIRDYKKGLNERKINLDDDYIKFIRFAEFQINRNGHGIVAMITNNSFIDGLTHRQMRKHLLETFDDIYILDLHGSTKKKERAPDSSKDENVFNIEQGVSISILIRKSGKKTGLGIVHHAEIYGTRKFKFKQLKESEIRKLQWTTLNYFHPNYFFVPKNFSSNEEYEKGFKIDEIFPILNSGVKTDRDALFIDKNKDLLESRMQRLLSGYYDESFRQAFRVSNSSSYKLTDRLKNKLFNKDYVRQIQYRPFDYQWIYYDPSLISRPGQKVFRHMVSRDNLVLLTCRQQSTFDFQHAFISKDIVDICVVSLQTKETGYAAPLYLYLEDGTKISNLKKEIVMAIEKIVGEVVPENIFDYIYAILHSPNYREKYKEFLKIDFPRIPYPTSKENFAKLAKIGQELRELHLLESQDLNRLITIYPVSGSDIVEKIEYRDGDIYINSSQYFGNVPEVAWNFWIGGYQPAQKWLKDRKGRSLESNDIEHYQKIIKVLVETDRIMKEIDKV